MSYKGHPPNLNKFNRRIMTRSYYCNTCQKVVTFDAEETVKKCSCSKVFESSVAKTHEINMNRHWSRQTKVEFSQSTIGQDLKDRGL
mgnify:CR=1 FL=1